MSNASNICLSFNTNKIKYIKTKVEQVFLFLFCDLGSINTNRSARIFFIAANTQLEIKKNDDNGFSKTEYKPASGV